jgi:hypothetical protein
MRRTKNPAPIATGRFASATLVEWIGAQRCHTPKRFMSKPEPRTDRCYADHCDGGEPMSYCWRHDLSWEHSKRLLRWQVRRLAPRPQLHFCDRCKDTGYFDGGFYADAVGILAPWVKNALPECPDCPRCVVCCVEAYLHTEPQEERCAGELKGCPELMPGVMRHFHWIPRGKE